MRISCFTFFLLSWLSVYSSVDAWSVLSSKMESLISSRAIKDEDRILSLSDSIFDILKEPECRNFRLPIRIEIYSLLADYKHSKNEIDEQYYHHCYMLCSLSTYNLEDFSRNNDIRAAGIYNLMKANVLMDFVDVVAHKPIKYYVLNQLNECLANIHVDLLPSPESSEGKELKNVASIKSPYKTFCNLKYKYEKALEAMNRETWFQQVNVLESKYSDFHGDFIKDIESIFEVCLDRTNIWNDIFGKILSLKSKETQLLWNLGYYMEGNNSKRDYKSSKEYQKFLCDLYFAGTKEDNPYAWLLYIHKKFSISPEESKLNQEFKRILLSLKKELRDYDFAYWYGYDILAEYYDNNNPSELLMKLNCYSKAMMYRNSGLDYIIEDSKRLSFLFAKSKLDFQNIGGWTMSHIIMWYRRYRDLNLNFASTNDEQLVNILDGLRVLLGGMSYYGKFDYHKSLSEFERDTILEEICHFAIKTSFVTWKPEIAIKTLNLISSAITNFGNPELASDIRDLSIIFDGSLSDSKKSELRLRVLERLVNDAENKENLNCYRLLSIAQTEELAGALGLSMVNLFKDNDMNHKEKSDKIESYYKLLRYLCGPHDYNLNVKDVYDKFKTIIP